MTIKKRYILPVLLLFAVGLFLGMKIESVLTSSADTYEQLRKLEDAFLIIDRQYVEDVNAKEIVENAINGILKDLDPHSSYISAEEIAEVQEGYQGSFGGIGVWFEAPPEDTARVTSTIADGPSEGVGVMAGDRMVAVEDSSIVGMGSLAIQKRLKGPVGTPVRLTIKRPGVSEPLNFTIVRGRIPLYSIDSSYMIDEKTGYIRIGRFAMTTHQEFVEHLARLKDKGMQQLVLDLRDNPGGIKQTAVGIADELLRSGETIVYTRGRNAQENETDLSTRGGTLESAPVIVLVNENSASGSEILAGALQDHDRALIVGRRTFGKALVQRPFQLRDGSVLQITVSRYYTPSGRLIQTPYENGELESYYKQKFSSFEKSVFHPSEYIDEVPDSLKFETTHGRTVFGGGGIFPDVVVAPDSTASLSSPVIQALVRRGVDVLYVRDWFNADEQTIRARWMDQQQTFVDTYQVDDAFVEDFWEFAKTKDIVISDTEPADPEEGRFTTADLEANRATLEVILKARIAQRLYRSEAWFPVFNQIDPTLLAAMELWEKAEALNVHHTN